MIITKLISFLYQTSLWKLSQTLLYKTKLLHTWSKRPSLSVLMYIGHHPLVRFCLNKLIIGTDPSVLSMSKVHCFTVLAPLGNRFKSKVMAPRKSSFEKWSASQTCKVNLAGTLQRNNWVYYWMPNYRIGGIQKPCRHGRGAGGGFTKPNVPYYKIP